MVWKVVTFPKRTFQENSGSYSNIMYQIPYKIVLAFCVHMRLIPVPELCGKDGIIVIFDEQRFLKFLVNVPLDEY